MNPLFYSGFILSDGLAALTIERIEIRMQGVEG